MSEVNKELLALEDQVFRGFRRDSIDRLIETAAQFHLLETLKFKLEKKVENS